MFRSSILVILATAACARSTPTPAALPGGEWRLATIGGAEAQPAAASARPWIRFEADSARLSGHLGCNRAAGPYTVAGEELRFGPIVSTRMACADDAMNRQEAALGGALQSTNRFRIRGDTLDLVRDTTVLATFVRSP